MKKPSIERRWKWWKGWLDMALAIGSGSIILNIIYGQFPLYYYQGSDPLIAIPLGAVVEILVWISSLLLIGLITELIRRLFRGGISWHLGARVWAMLSLEIYVVKSIFDISMRDGLFRYYEVYWPDDEMRIIGLLAVALITGILFGVVRRASGPEMVRKDEWKITFFSLFLILAYGYIYNRWMNTTVWPLPPVIAGTISLLVISIGGGIILFRRRYRLLNITIILTSASLFGAVILAIWYRVPASDPRSDIIVSVWDTARAGRMSLYGYENKTTPGLESLASRSVIFDNAFSTANYTYPAHISFFTGKSYREHNYHIGNGEEYDRYQSEFTLPDYLREAGYHTVLFTENPWLLMSDKGFDEVRFFPIMGMYASGRNKRDCEVGFPVKIIKYFNPFLGRRLIDTIIYRFDGFYSYTIDKIILRHIQRLFVKRRRTGPIFLFWNLMNVHNRYHPFSSWKHGAEVNNYNFPEEYDRAMLRADQRFMDLYRLVGRCGHLDRTTFLVTSDHGEFLGESGLWGHNIALFEPVIRIPLMISRLGLNPRRESSPVSLVSLRGLLESLVDERLPYLSGSITGYMTKPDNVISEFGYLPEDGGAEYKWSYSIINDQYQYINDPRMKTYGSSFPPVKSRFLFKKPFGSKNNQDILKSTPGRALKLEEKYSGYLRDLKNQGKTIVHDGAEVDRVEKLRALGYLQ
ncbi:MAG TPA: hypothetical protein ENH12_02855 [Proteobacteria bacterium]|nr:hypothetical protein [Pseudomonadota bacterium]